MSQLLQNMHAKLRLPEVENARVRFRRESNGRPIVLVNQLALLVLFTLRHE